MKTTTNKRSFKVEFTSPFTGTTVVTAYGSLEAAKSAIESHEKGERMGKPGKARLLP